MIFRTYPDRESRIFAWTMSKDALKLFRKQRDQSKYRIMKLYIDDKEEFDDIHNGNMLDFLILKSVIDKKPIKFLTTDLEVQQYEKDLQKYFLKLPALVQRAGGKTTLLQLFMNLKEEYKEALDFIGYRPEELTDLFDDEEYSRCGTKSQWIEGDIESEYIDKYDSEARFGGHIIKPVGQNAFNDVFSKIIYSAESFVKMRKEDF